MLIKEEKAQEIAKLSYKLYELGLLKSYITFKRASELDVETGDKVIAELSGKLKSGKMKKEVETYGGLLFYVGDEILVIDNYLYLESIEYDYFDHGIPNNKQRVPEDITCNFSDGSSCIIPSGITSRMYAPHVYEFMISDSSGVQGTYNIGKYPSISDTIKRVMYLKMIIAEDRLVNPYIVIEQGIHGRVDHNYMMPMYEATRHLQSSDEEIDLLNEIIKVCEGNLIVGMASLTINIKATALYLEGQERYDLSMKVRKYEKDPFPLNSVIKYANNSCYGITFNGGRKKVVLI
jgi:hypothetical protein